MKNMKMTARWIMLGFTLMALILGGVLGYDLASGTGLVRNNPGISYTVGGLLLVTAMIASVLWWLSIDEAQREAHKWAWYWGGSTGLMVSVAIFIVAMMWGGRGDDRLYPLHGV